MSTFAQELIVRITLVVCIGLTLVWILRKASGAIKHQALLLTLIGVAVMPALMSFGPAWKLLVPAPVAPQLPQVVELKPVPKLLVEPANTPHQSPLDEPVPAAIQQREPFDPSKVVLTIWLLGAAVLLARRIHQVQSLRKIIREGTAVSPEIANQFQSLAGTQAAKIQILSTELSAPATWGQTILLPKSSHTWTEQHTRVVLLHELAHLQRRDALSQSLAYLVCASCWFNPLLWVASQRLCQEAENACDEQVLQNGITPSLYAKVLLETARGLRGLPVAGMANSHLESRLVRILKGETSKGGRALKLAVTCAIALALTLIGGARLEAIAKPMVTQSQGSGIEKTLPDGTVVRLDSVGRIASNLHPEDAWLPDGTAYKVVSEKLIPNNIEGTPGFNRLQVQFTIRSSKNDLESKPASISVIAIPKNGSAIQFFPHSLEIDHSPMSIKSGLPLKGSMADLRVSVATGTWITKRTLKLNDPIFKNALGVQIRTGSRLIVIYKNGTHKAIPFPVTEFPPLSSATRIVAVDSNSKELPHAGIKGPMYLMKGSAYGPYDFAKAIDLRDPGKVKAFQLQTRKYNFATFPNVKLKPADEVVPPRK